MSEIQFTDLIVPNGGIDESKSSQAIGPTKWTSASNVEPLPDGVRRRKGSSASNAVAIQSINISHEDGTSDREFYEATSEYISQGFLTTSAITLSRIGVRLKISAGTPTEDIDAAIYTDTAGSPNAVVTGLDFSDFVNVTSASVGSEYKWIFFTVATGVALSDATTYHLVIFVNTAAGTGTDTYAIEEVTTPSGYSGGTVNYSTDGSSWTPVAAADLNFRIYAGTPAIVSIADYRLADGTSAYHLVGAGGELYKLASGVMTAVSARDRLTMTAADDTLHSWTVGNDRFLFTNGTDIAKKFYLLGGTEYYENESIAKPTATLTLTSPVNGASDLTAGTYQVDYYYWNDDLGIASDRRYNGASTTPSIVVSGGDDITISAIPTTTVRENDRATHIRFETKETGDAVFRLHKQVTIGTTSTTIITNDETTVAEYEHAIAPVHSIKAVAENQQFIAGISATPYRLMYSAIVGATSHYESFPANNFRDFGKGDGDYITALFFVPPRALVVGFKNSIWAIDPRNPGTSDRFLISRNVGIANHRAGVVVGRKLFFVSDATENKGMFVWTGSGEPANVPGIDNTFKGLNLSRLDNASCAHYAPGEDRFQWWTLLASSGSSSQDRILVYDYQLDAWTIYTKSPAGNILGNIETIGASTLLMGGRVGVEHLQDDSTQTTDSGTSYLGTVELGAMDFGIPHIKKRLRWLDYHTAPQSTGSILVNVQADYGESGMFTGSLQQIVPTAAVWATGATWDTTAKWGSTGLDKFRRTALRGSGRVFRPTFTGGSAWHIKGLSFGIQGTKKR